MKHLEVKIKLPLDRFDLDVQFETNKGVTGIFGPSGAGKTSLLETIAGLRPEARGRVALHNQASEELWLDTEQSRFEPVEHRRIGYVPQDGLLFPHWNVRRNLMAGSHRAMASDSTSTDLGELGELGGLVNVARLLELEPLLDRSVNDLSGGERQRVALGRALCSGPGLLLLDEPLASLDLPLRRRLLTLLRRVRSELTVPMLLVSHDPIEVQALCDELLVLQNGSIIGRGEPADVLTDQTAFPLSNTAEPETFVNVLPGKIASKDHRGTRIELPGGTELLTTSAKGKVGAEGLVELPANQILLAMSEPAGLSARNSLPATVTELRSIGSTTLVRARLGAAGPTLGIEVTESAPNDLGLTLGSAVFLVVKATSCRFY